MATASGRTQSKSKKSGHATSAPVQTGASSHEIPPYAAVFDSLPQAIALWRLICDDDDRPCDLEIVATNEAFRRIVNIPDPVSHKLANIDPHYRDREPNALEIVARVASTKSMEAHEIYHPQFDRWLEFKIAPAPGDLFLSYTEDVTKRRAVESSVRRLQYSLDQIDDYPTWSDPTGRIIEVSASTCRHLEYTRDELLNMTLSDICPDIDIETWKRSWATPNSHTGLRIEGRHRTKSGRIFPVELVINRIVFEGNQYHCTFCRDISERKYLEKSLTLTQLSVDHAPDMIHWLDPDGYITYANRSMCEFLGYTLEELQSMHISEVNPELTPESFKQRWAAKNEGIAYFADETWATKDGRLVSVDISATHVRQEDKVMGLAFVRDVTERKLAEQTLKESEERYRELFDAQTETLKALRERDEQLLQAQKMEAIGRLAGGIAHDFNNVLTTIIGYSDLILSSPECPEGSIAEDIVEIKEAAQRAGSLTQRVLAFSRRQAMKPTLLSLNDIVSDTERLLARTIGADIEFKTSLSPELGQVEVDDQQFVQVLLNLAVNARDAMPKGGTLIIETANIDLDERFCKTQPEGHPGPYVKLTVTDTGCGMDQEVLDHVFEPFYTTKPPGLGTGLGLATAYGIVAQSGGFIDVDSELDRGTTFSVYLPRAYSAPINAENNTAAGEGDPDNHTLMVVDSDQPFLTLTTRILGKRGLKVLPFTSGERAAKVLTDSSVRIDALLADTALSGDIQGWQLAKLAARYRPGLPVLFTGAQTTGGQQQATENENLTVTYLEKPFTVEELTHWVRTWLTGPERVDM